MKTIVIDRSRWRTGGNWNKDLPTENLTGKGATFLRNEQGFQCCLGFVCEAEGVAIAGNKAYPCSLHVDVPNLTEPYNIHGILFKDSELTGKAVKINDDPNTTVAQKEAALKELFAGIYNLEFVGEPVKFEE